MDKRGAKGYWLSTARIVNQQLFDEYVSKVIPWLKEVNGEVFAKDTEPQGKEKTEDANLAVICEFPSMRAAVEAYESEEYKELSNLRKEATENSVQVSLDYGLFIETVLDFIIVGFTIFLVVKFINKLRVKADDIKDVSVPTPADIKLLSNIEKLLEEQNKLLKKK